MHARRLQMMDDLSTRMRIALEGNDPLDAYDEAVAQFCVAVQMAERLRCVLEAELGGRKGLERLAGAVREAGREDLAGWLAVAAKRAGQVPE